MLEQILLIQFLRQHGQNTLCNLDFEHYNWELLIRQARRANLLSRIAVFLQTLELLEKIPEKPRLHFLNSIHLANANARSAKYEVQQIHKALHSENIDFVLLKGAAYIWANTDSAQGRLFSDTDIMVSKMDLDAAESALIKKGWFGDFFDNYKQRYYREWMHEIPPLQHLQRQTTLDVHHTIIPPTSRLKPKPKKLWEHADALENMPGLFVLSPVDMILHSATHLFHEGEFNQGLRDISDLDLLLRQFIVPNNQWESLLARAIELNLERPLYYALNYTQRILHTPIPDFYIDEAAKLGNLNALQKGLMNALFLRALAPNHSTCKVTGLGVASELLYIRSHWLRMPIHLLIPHLARKSWMQFTGKSDH
jgi:hypothetical protein